MSNEPSENWDDDFLFTANDPPRQPDHPTSSTHDDFLTPSSSRPTNNAHTTHDYSDDTTHSRFSFASSAWDVDDTASVAGPSSTTKRRPSNEQDAAARPAPNLAQWSEEQSFDQDDDMDFASPPSRNVAAPRKLTSHQTLRPAPETRPRRGTDSQPGPSTAKWTTETSDETNYDQDFEDYPRAASVTSPPAHQSSNHHAYRPPSVASTRSSSRHGARNNQHAHTRSSSSLHLPHALPSGSSRNMRSASPSVTPGSPTLSSFSALVSLSSERSRSSTNPLLPFASSSSPPRTRRRLRKKSRPPEFDGTVMEMLPPRPTSSRGGEGRVSGSSDGYGYNHSGYLDDSDMLEPLDEDRDGDHTFHGRPRPASALALDRRSASPFDTRLDGAASPTAMSFFHGPSPAAALSSSSPPSSPPRRVPLLSRIGSMKRWRSRRASTASQDVSMDTSMDTSLPYAAPAPETPEPGARSRATSPNPSGPSHRTSWLFSRATPSPAIKGKASASFTHERDASTSTASATSPEVKRSNSSSRPPSRYGRKRSTTVEDVLREQVHEERDADDEDLTERRRAGAITPTPAILDDHLSALPASTSAASSSGSGVGGIFGRGSGRASRRPLSLQPQRPSGPPSNSSGSLRIGSVGRSTSNPFTASQSKENILSTEIPSVEERAFGAKGRIISSGSMRGTRRSPHKRSISLTSDMDEGNTSGYSINTGRRSPSLSGLGLFLHHHESPPPPVPPLPLRHQSNDSTRSSSHPNSHSPSPLLPPIALSPPSPPDSHGRSTGPVPPLPSPFLFAPPSTPPASPIITSSSSRLQQLQRQHSSSVSSTQYPGTTSSASSSLSSARGMSLLSANGNANGGPPPSISAGQSLSLGRGAQALASQFLDSSEVGSTSLPASASATSSSGAGSKMIPSALSSGSGMPSSGSGTGSSATLRRSSLGDLKIPTRISMAQTGLRNNLGMLREFAGKVDDIQRLQTTRTMLLTDMFGPPTPAPVVEDITASTSSLLPAPPSVTFDTRAIPSVEELEQQYALWWECAELLVELGSGGATPSNKGTPPPAKDKQLLNGSTSSAPASSDDDPTITLKNKGTEVKENEDPTITLKTPASESQVRPLPAIPARPRERQRSITLAGNEKSLADVSLDTAITLSTQHTVRASYNVGITPPPSANTLSSHSYSNMDSKGRKDLSVRQLALLKEMLETPDPSVFDRHHSPLASASGIRFASQPESGSHGRLASSLHNHPSASAITLPSIPSSPHPLATAASSTDVSDHSSNLHSINDRGSGKASDSAKGTGKVKRLQRFRDMLRSLTNTSPNLRNSERPNLSSTSELDVSRREPLPKANGMSRRGTNASEEKEQKRRRKSTDPALVTGRASDSLAAPPPPPQSLKHINSPYGGASLAERERAHRSPRRPSLASIFKIGQSQAAAPSTPLTNHTRKRRLRRKPSATPSAKPAASRTSGTDDDDLDEGDYSDWDRMDSASDLEGGLSPTPRRPSAANNPPLPPTSPGGTKPEQATIRGKRGRGPSFDYGASSSRDMPPPPVPPLPYDRSAAGTPTPASRSGNGNAMHASSSQISLGLRASPSKPRLTGRLRSRTTEVPPPMPPPAPPSIGLIRPSLSSSGIPASATSSTLNPADFKLALTPENIRPLLEYAKEVSARLSECVAELKTLHAVSTREPSTPAMESASLTV